MWRSLVGPPPRKGGRGESQTRRWRRSSVSLDLLNKQACLTRTARVYWLGDARSNCLHRLLLHGLSSMHAPLTDHLSPCLLETSAPSIISRGGLGNFPKVLRRNLIPLIEPARWMWISILSQEAHSERFTSLHLLDQSCSPASSLVELPLSPLASAQAARPPLSDNAPPALARRPDP